MTEVTGVPSDFNSHQVVVAPADVERALEVLDEATPDADDDDAQMVDLEPDRRSGLSSLRRRWVLLAFAVVLLTLVLLDTLESGAPFGF